MILSKGEIHNRDIIQEAEPSNFYDIGYDLRIKEIICGHTEKGNNTFDIYELNPGATVFVSTEESLKMSLDTIGIIVPKNSLIRAGLRIEAPIYQPEHNTRIFIRVTNISSDIFRLKKGQQIAAIMFAEINGTVDGYSGKYVDEFDYKGVAEYPKDTIPQLVKVEKKINEIKDLEDKILNKVINIITIFVGLFTLINININFIKERSLWDMLIYNLMTVGIIGILIGFICILTKKTSSSDIKRIMGASAILIIVSIIITSCTVPIV